LKLRLLPAVLGMLGLAVSLPAHAETPPAPVSVHRVVFELNTDNPAAWNGVLNNLQNTQKRFGVDNTELELVAHGPGIGIMLKSNQAQAARMESLSKQHITFAACHNTMEAKHIRNEDLLPFVTVVPSGVGEVILKQEAGWVYIKAGF